jgi:hypothetical protein
MLPLLPCRNSQTSDCNATKELMQVHVALALQISGSSHLHPAGSLECPSSWPHSVLGGRPADIKRQARNPTLQPSEAELRYASQPMYLDQQFPMLFGMQLLVCTTTHTGKFVTSLLHLQQTPSVPAQALSYNEIRVGPITKPGVHRLRTRRVDEEVAMLCNTLQHRPHGRTPSRLRPLLNNCCPSCRTAATVVCVDTLLANGRSHSSQATPQ